MTYVGDDFEREDSFMVWTCGYVFGSQIRDVWQSFSRDLVVKAACRTDGESVVIDPDGRRVCGFFGSQS